MKISSKHENDPNPILDVLQNKLTITCDLCNHPVIDPKVCPSCNQLFCFECLIKYHQVNKNCPLCHQKLSMSQFLEFDCNNFLDFFRKQLKELKISKQVLRQSSKEQIRRFSLNESCKNEKQKEYEQQKCPQHDIPFRYFCQTCSKPICSDCGMMSGNHKSHKFIRLNDIYTKIKQKLNTQLNRLTAKIFESQEHSLKIKKKLQKLQIQHMHIKRYTQQYYILLVQKFEQQITAKTVYLKQIQEKNNKEIEFYELYRDGICQEIQRKSRNQLINDSDKILTSFTIQVCETPEPLKVQQSFQTIKQLLPEYNNFQYCLRNFSSCGGGIVYSDPFLLNGVQWRLKIYPKGNGVAKGKYLSVFVQMTKAQRNQKKYEYKIQLINKDLTSQNIRREYCSAFDIGECWGYNQFILLQELLNGFLDSDDLYFVMGIRNADYRSLSQDQFNYILKLQNEVKLKQLERENQVEQTNIIDDLQNNSYTLKSPSSLNNQTKFLKFLQNSSFNEQRINERKQKQREKQLQKSQKDQQYEQFYENTQVKFKRQQKTTNKNLQTSDVVEVKPERTEFFIKDYSSEKGDDFDEFQENDFLKKQKQSFGKMRQSTKEEQKPDKNRPSIGFSQKQSLKQRKIQKQYVSQNENKNTRIETKPDKKEVSKNQQKVEEKYQFYFSNSKKIQPQSKKQYKKYQSSKVLDEDNFFKKQIIRSQAPKIYKNDFKEIKKISESKLKQKVEEQKPKIQSKEELKTEEKPQQKKEGIKTKKYIKGSPSKIKSQVEQNQNRKKQISNILQQSKKLEGISEEKVSSFISITSQVKDPGSNNSILRSPIKSGHLKQQRQKEEHKPSLRKLKDFQNDKN